MNHRGCQRVLLRCVTEEPIHALLTVLCETEEIVSEYSFALCGGEAEAAVMLPAAKQDMDTVWRITDTKGAVLSETKVLWKRPRELTLYVMTSSHTDIGLHNSQYIQRYNSSVFTDKAKALCDETKERPEENRYRYVMEGTWFFENYIWDRSEEEAKDLIENYIRPGKIGVCCCVAGNHTQMYGLEELCMSTYEKSKLEEKYHIKTRTMSMIDNNGITMSLIAPYANAGIENIIFAPNQWNPIPSTVWKTDKKTEGYTWNPEAQGGGARIDIRYTSNLPMLFYWKDAASEKRLLVWGSTQYGFGGEFWGISQRKQPTQNTVGEIETVLEKNLPVFESRYPYDVWLFEAYDDDMEPNLYLADTIELWNTEWAWPRFRMLGNPDEPFDRVREKYQDQIPVLEGDITGGWYQHPLSTPELAAKKFALDRLLPTAEKMATLACLISPKHGYPKTDFRRAWDALLFHDEHSYGTSGYQGKRVYETWIQHNDWLNKVKETAKREIQKALSVIAGEISTDKDSLVVFNPTSSSRKEWVEDREGTYALLEIPAMGYRAEPRETFRKFDFECRNDPCPVVENQYYRVSFGNNGAVKSIYDKERKRELLSRKSPYGANEPIYTKDNHRTYEIPGQAKFEVKTSPERIVVRVWNRDSIAGADLIRTVTLDHVAKRIDFDNELFHARDFYNNCRYDRYLYFAFPFEVPGARRYCHLNGSVAEYGKTITGHGTDVYMAVNEWCCVENEEIGVALIMPDSTLVEFDHIHPDKTDWGNPGEGSSIYNYVANDWLQMHAYGSDYFNFHFRYSIVSYEGGFEQAKIPVTAEQLCTPVQKIKVGIQQGKYKENSRSLLETDSAMRLIGLKCAGDGDGMIARFYGKWDDPEIKSELLLDEKMEALTTNEQEKMVPVKGEHGFHTCILGKETLHFTQREPEKREADEVGSVYTGLMTSPAAARGEDPGHLYLLWGKAEDEDIVCYRLYRGETSDFVCDEGSLVSEVDPGKYRVVSYEDRGLENYKKYYYRVCGVHEDGSMGKLSQVFSGITKE